MAYNYSIEIKSTIIVLEMWCFVVLAVAGLLMALCRILTHV